MSDNPYYVKQGVCTGYPLSGEHTLHGFTNRELREHLVRVGYPLAAEAARQSGQVTRCYAGCTSTS